MDRLIQIEDQKERKDLNNSIAQRDLIDMYRTFYATAAAYTFFSSTKMENMLGHRS